MQPCWPTWPRFWADHPSCWCRRGLCHRLGLDQLPADLPKKLRKAELKGEAAQYIPGGPQSYLNILAAEVDSHRRLLLACNGPAKSEQEAAQRIADGVKAIVDWWTLHGYTFDRDAKVFGWDYVWHNESGTLFTWARCRSSIGQTWPSWLPSGSSGRERFRQALPRRGG